MSTQPEALRLAALLEDPVNSKIYLAPYIAAELRRLHEVTQGANDMRTTLYNLLDKYFDRFAFGFALFACSFFILHAIALIVSVILGLSLR